MLLSASDTAVSLLRDMSASERDATEVTDFRSASELEIAGLPRVAVPTATCCCWPATATSRLKPSPPSKSLERDQRFHEAIAAATHNHLIVALSRATSEWVSDFRRISHASPTGRATSLTGHRAILAAIDAGDSA